MESPEQATQRKIFLESLDLVQVRRPDVHVYSELLVQYRVKGEVRRVVPDNMVCVNAKQVPKASFNVELQPVGPLWVVEWVSSSSEGKDYGEAFQKYEHDLKVPYCLQFHPEEQDFRFYHHDKRRYRPVAPNAQGRYPLPELEMEIGLLESWVRFWFRGELLPLPADMQKQIDELKEQAANLKEQAAELGRRAAEAHRTAEEEKARRVAMEQELAQLKAGLARTSDAQPPNG